MNIPPCPACSGVLRPRGFEDAVRCRCGFEVTGEALLAASCYADPARQTRELLAAGRMIPIPQGTPGIRISENFGSIAKDLWDPRCVGKPDPAVVKAIAETAIRVGARLGLDYQGEALGRDLVLPSGTYERQKLYALSPLPDVLACAEQMVEVIAKARGPGDWWSTGGAVGMICDDGQMCLEDIGGVPHVRMRALYFHEPKAAAPIGRVRDGRLETLTSFTDILKSEYQRAPAPTDPLLVETDGLQLRELLVIDEVYRREETSARNTLTAPQRQAVSAHWSAQLRLKLAASVSAERKQVVLDTEDE